MKKPIKKQNVRNKIDIICSPPPGPKPKLLKRLRLWYEMKYQGYLRQKRKILDIAIDLGTGNLCCLPLNPDGTPDFEHMIDQPSMVVMEKVEIDGKVVEYVAKIGDDAKLKINELNSEAEDAIDASRVLQPIENGEIKHPQETAQMLRVCIEAIKKSLNTPRKVKINLVIPVPVGLTDLNKYTVRLVAEMAGAASIRIVEQPFCAMLGSGYFHPKSDEPNFCSDIGDGTSQKFLYTGGVDKSVSQDAGGAYYTSAWQDHLAQERNFKVDVLRAEKSKIEIGAAMLLEKEEDVAGEITGRFIERMEFVNGKFHCDFIEKMELTEEEKFCPYCGKISLDLENTLKDCPCCGQKWKTIEAGKSTTIKVYRSETVAAFDGLNRQLAQNILFICSSAKAGLVADFADPDKPCRMFMAGGGSALHNLPELLSQELGFKILLVKDPLYAVVIGAANLMGDPKLLKLRDRLKEPIQLSLSSEAVLWIIESAKQESAKQVKALVEKLLEAKQYDYQVVTTPEAKTEVLSRRGREYLKSIGGKDKGDFWEFQVPDQTADLAKRRLRNSRRMVPVQPAVLSKKRF